jgi:hypothetical protein
MYTLKLGGVKISQFFEGWGMREILEICQKCDMKYDMIDLHLSTTIEHINM